MDRQEHDPERGHPQQIGGAHELRPAVGLGTQSGKTLVRGNTKSRVRVNIQKFGGRIGRDQFDRHHQQPPACRDNVDADDDANGLNDADETTEIPNRCRASEIDEAVKQ